MCACQALQGPGEFTLSYPLNSHHSGEGGAAIMGEHMQRVVDGWESSWTSAFTAAKSLL